MSLHASESTCIAAIFLSRQRHKSSLAINTCFSNSGSQGKTWHAYRLDVQAFDKCRVLDRDLPGLHTAGSQHSSALLDDLALTGCVAEGDLLVSTACPSISVAPNVRKLCLSTEERKVLAFMLDSSLDSSFDHLSCSQILTKVFQLQVKRGIQMPRKQEGCKNLLISHCQRIC